MENYIIISFIILVVASVVIWAISSIKSRNTYLKYLKTNLPTVAENIIHDILDKKITMDDIFVFNSEGKATAFTTDFFIMAINYIKNHLENYIIKYIEENVRNKFVAKLLKDFVKLDPSIITEAIDVVLDSSNKEGKELYDKLLDTAYAYAINTLDSIEEEESKALEEALAYENETVENVSEYNGEFDTMEEVEEIEYPDEENLDDIPEELVEIVAGSETEEEIELDDASDGEVLSFDDDNQPE